MKDFSTGFSHTDQKTLLHITQQYADQMDRYKCINNQYGRYFCPIIAKLPNGTKLSCSRFASLTLGKGFVLSYISQHIMEYPYAEEFRHHVRRLATRALHMSTTKITMEEALALSNASTCRLVNSKGVNTLRLEIII